MLIFSLASNQVSRKVNLSNIQGAFVERDCAVGRAEQKSIFSQQNNLTQLKPVDMALFNVTVFVGDLQLIF